jgi:hypothetical protein
MVAGRQALWSVALFDTKLIDFVAASPHQGATVLFYTTVLSVCGLATFFLPLQ